MANYTPNINLYKPNRVDPEEVDVTLSDNFEKIDTEFKNHKDQLEAHINEAESAHEATAIPYQDPDGNPVNVKVALDNLDSKVKANESDIDTLETRVDNIVVEAGNSNPEIVDARGSYTTLKNRLDTTDAHLAENTQLIGTKASFKGRWSRPLITFVTDDALTQDYTVFKDIFARQSVPCTTAVISDYVDTNSSALTKAQLLELQDTYGWEILSHSKSHVNLTTLTQSELQTELYESKKALNDMGLKCENLALPYGGYNDIVRREAAKYYRSVRRSGNNYETEVLPIDTHGLRGVWITDNTTVDAKTGYPATDINHYKWFIDKAVANNGWLIIATHSWEIQSWNYQTMFEDLIVYAKSQAQVVTFKQALDMLENVTESGNSEKPSSVGANYTKQHFTIGADGNASSLQLNTLRMPDNAVTNATPPSYFKNGNMTFCSIRTDGDKNFPEGKGGLLTTYKFSQYDSNVAFFYQTYKLYGENKTYIRTATGSETWGSWDVYNKSIVKPANTYNGLTPLSSFPSDEVSINIILSANADTGLPELTAGTLITYRFSAESGFSYQVFKKYNTNNKWIRYATSTSAWGAWERDNATVDIEGVNRYSASQPITDFPRPKITVFDVNSSGNTGYPGSGTCTVYRSMSGDGFARAEFRKYGTNEVYSRYVDASGVWTAWVKISAV